MTSVQQTVFNLLLTYRCNYECRHCISDCGPARRETMSFDEARRWIDEAAECLGPSQIGYTGGEPFLLYEQLRKLIEYGRQRHGIAGGVVTNCYWAGNAISAGRRIRELHAAGLRNIVVSLDDHHLEFVSPEQVKRVVHAALGLGISVCVNTVVTRTGSIRKNDVPRLLGLSPADIARGAVMLKEFGPLKIGRAAREIAPAEYIETDQADHFDGACGFVTKIPTVTPDGSVFACCCFGNSAGNPADRIGYCGDAREGGLRRVLSVMEDNLLFRLFAECGPYRVLQLAMASSPWLSTHGRYLSNCDVCVELYHNPALRETLLALLRKWSIGKPGERA
ncbi:MAG TPA: radical SAM protein [Candidatus Deferrimicrobiaceae bacterium]|jgi:MoaA/NifB/PqqE/SkfB family radical SAM enzyme